MTDTMTPGRALAQYVTDKTAEYGGRFLPERCGMPRFHGDEPHGAWVPITEEEAKAR